MIFNFRASDMGKKPRKTTSLLELRQGQRAVISQVDEDLTELMELGFVPGARITPARSGVRDPRVYELDGTLVAVRLAAARHIHVTPADAGTMEGD
jgi:Fe2+ transport system protein FeoA